MKNTNAAVINTSLENLFSQFLLFTRPLNGLTNSEIKLVSLFLYNRYKLTAVIKDEKYLDKILFGHDVREEIREEMGMKPDQFNNTISRLRKKGVIVGKSISKKYIPSIAPGSNEYNLVFKFKYEGV